MTVKDLPASARPEAMGRRLEGTASVIPMNRILRGICTLIVGIPLATSSLASKESPYVAPRGPAGKPDMNGTWRAMSRANDDIEAHAAKAAMAFREGPAGPVPAKEVVAIGAVGAVPAGMGVVVGGAIPYRPEARAKKAENQKNWLTRDPEIKCYQPGIPRATYMPYPFQILHNEDALFFAYEYAGAVRNILLEDPGPAPIDSWMGQSVGRWEGDTLVIETTGQHDQTWLDRAGNFHSEALRVVERFTLTSPHTMNYEATLEDEKIFTRPWTIRMTLYRLRGDDARLQQFNCIEFVEELLYGHLRKNPLD
jgi:hypothetical protein